MTAVEEDSEPSRATLSRVAVDADVSISTVSKVLNGRAGVSDATRAKVEELLRDHGYNRRSTMQTVAPLIEIVFESMDSVWALEIMVGAERVARDNGMSIVVTESGDRHSPSPGWIDGAIRRRPAGVILVFSDLTPEHKHRLRSRNIPFVLVDPSGDVAPDVPAIGSANWSGGYQAGRHLIDLGHRDIAIITGPEDQMSSTARVSGFRAALESAGIPLRPEYVAVGTFGVEAGVHRGHELLTLPQRPTAIFAGNDQQAFGLYEAARSLGIAIPSELSVIGYDDLMIAAWAGPPLTTVRQPLREMAEAAAMLILQLRNDQIIEGSRVDLATRLVVRDSTRPL